MKVFFVSGVDTDVGKTFVAQKLIDCLIQRGIRALSIKPIETGSEENPPDSMLHFFQAKAIFPMLKFEEINFYSFELPSAPSVADVKKIISLENVFEKISQLQNKGIDILLIEGAGGLFTPIKDDYFMLSFAQDLKRRLDAKVILICDDRLGMIHRFLSAKFILDSFQLESLFFVNILNQEIFSSINLPFIKQYDFEMEIKSLADRILKG